MPRSNGEGSVYRRQDGRWVAAVRDRVTRKRRAAYFATRAEAEKALRRMATRAEDGQVVLGAGMTVETYVSAWLDGRGSRRRRESTVREYRRRLEGYVVPFLGGIKVRDLTVLDVEDLLESMARKGLGRWSIVGTRNALSAVLRDAVRAGHVPANAARLAELPGVKAPEAKGAPTDAQVAALLEAAKGTELEYLLPVMAMTGVRIGEALGAQWSDLDLEAGTWTVRRTTTVDEAGRTILGNDTKPGGARTLVLAPEVVVALRAQRRAVAEARLACPGWTDLDLVFPSAVGTVWDPRNARKVLRPLTEAVGFPGSFHALRHYVATVAVSTVPVAVASKVLGHKRTATTTDLYAHLLDSDAGKVAVAVNLAVNRGREATS